MLIDMPEAKGLKHSPYQPYTEPEAILEKRILLNKE